MADAVIEITHGDFVIEGRLQGEPGLAGPAGQSAYQLAQAHGFTGTEAEWLGTLKGEDGAAANAGAPGQSAYQLAVASGFVGTEAEWLASLKGADGEDGASGGLGASQVFPELSGKVTGLAIPYAQISAGGAAWFADLGARAVPVVRVDAYWDQIQAVPAGAYNWTGLDAVVDGLRANGVHVLLVPSNKPAWGSSALANVADRQACADFCGALASHFLGRCDNFEIVNEPNKTAISPATYADLLKRAFVAVKRANPLALVISGGLSPVEATQAGMTGLQDWMDGFYSVPNIGAYFDQFGFHPYSLPWWASDPESADTGWGWMTSVVRARMVTEGDGRKPIAVTEMGFVSDSDAAYNGAAGQAEAVQEVIAACLATDWVGCFFLYGYRDLGGSTTSAENWFGMLTPTGADKPLAATFAAAASGGYAGSTAAGVPYDDTALMSRVEALEGASVAWTDIDDIPSAFPPSAHRHQWADLDGVPAAFAPAAHTHDMGDVSGLSSALESKADISTVWTAEMIQDAVAAMFQSGTHTNAAISYDDATGTLNITASGSGASVSQEDVEDLVGGLVQQGTGINVVYDDVGNVLSIALSGESFTTAEKNKLFGIATGATANATDAQLRDRSTHTGAQAISTITGLQNALDGKMAATTFKTVNGQAVTGSGDIVTAISFTTDAAAASYSASNPGVAVFSSQSA